MLRRLFHLVVVKPLVLIILGINARGLNNLPQCGPAILVANHNSHLDTLALMSLFSLNCLKNVHPVAAADYFCTNRWLNWFAVEIMGIIPIERKASTAGQDTLAPYLALWMMVPFLSCSPKGREANRRAWVNLKTELVIF